MAIFGQSHVQHKKTLILFGKFTSKMKCSQSGKHLNNAQEEFNLLSFG